MPGSNSRGACESSSRSAISSGRASCIAGILLLMRVDARHGMEWVVGDSRAGRMRRGDGVTENGDRDVPAPDATPLPALCAWASAQCLPEVGGHQRWVERQRGEPWQAETSGKRRGAAPDDRYDSPTARRTPTDQVRLRLLVQDVTGSWRRRARRAGII